MPVEAIIKDLSDLDKCNFSRVAVMTAKRGIWIIKGVV